MEVKDFWGNIPDDCKQAIKELKRMKVHRLCGYDCEETFTDVWWLVLHEVDMYEEGEFCREVSRAGSLADPSAMNLKQAQNANKWLVRWWSLAYRYSLPGNFSEFHDKHIAYYGERGINVYGGQLI